MPLVLFLEQERDQGCLPVMTVKHIRIEINVGDGLQHCAAEINKAFTVIIIAIQVRTVKIIFIVKKIVGNAVHFILLYTHILVAQTNLDVEDVNKLKIFFIFFGNTGVFWKNNADIGLILWKGLWQRADHIT